MIAEMMALMERLYPICRSLTGPGVEDTLGILGERLPMTVTRIPTGTRVLDWEVPNEWRVRDAYIADAEGERVVDFRRSNLHLVGYSAPVRARLPLSELRAHLHSLPEQPEVTPYRTSYYREAWGFCLPHTHLEAIPDGEYEVVVDSTLTPGHLTYGEVFLPGAEATEVLFSTHICHPSLANDNLSGMALLAALAERLAAQERRHGYRFLFLPGTIGPLAWLARNEALLPRVRHGLVVTGVGMRGPLTYKRSRLGHTATDRAAALALRESGLPHALLPWEPYGYDERQFCSPGFDLPVGRLSRTPHGEYPEYHTSADDLTFVHEDMMAEALDVLLRFVDMLEQTGRYRNLAPKGEPQLGRRGLYGALGGVSDPKGLERALLWVLSLSDTQHGLVDIAEASGLPFARIAEAARLLEAHHLLARESEA